MPGPYAFKQIFAADPSNSGNVAKRGAILLFAVGDPSRTPVVLKDLANGMSLPNPVPINDYGFGPAFLHETLPQVAWEGGGFSGTFESFEGLRADAVAAVAASQAAAQSASTAATNAATGAAAALSGAVNDAKAAATAAQASAGLVGAPAGDAVRAAIKPGGAAHGELSATIGDHKTYVEVEKKRLGTDVSDTERWQRAVDKAITLGIPVVRGTAPNYDFAARVDVKNANNLTIQGVGNRYVTMRSANPAGTNIFSISGGFNDLIIEGFNFEGTAIEKPDVPTRARTYGPNPMNAAVYMFGDLSLAPVATSVINNFTLRHCRIYGSSNLPLWLAGIRGKTTVTDCEFDNCYDPGLLYLDHLEFTHNKVIRSRDNGVSVSRGTKRAIVHSNYFENSAHWGIHVAGFLTTGDRNDPANFGPEEVLVHDNIVKGAGFGGINLEVGPKVGIVHNNLVSEVRRGPIDMPNDSFSLGIYVAGLSDGAGGYSAWAENWDIHDNTFLNIANGGVTVSVGSRNIRVHHNRAINIGTATKADGTAIASNDTGFNHGIRNAAGNTLISIEANEIYDMRATPYLNQPIILGGAYGVDNRAFGNRIALPMQSKRTQSELAINAPAGSAKVLHFEDAGTVRARLQMDVDGSVTLRLFDANGVATTTPISSRQSDGAITFATPAVFTMPIRVPSFTTASRPSAAISKGSTIHDQTLNKLLSSDGASWRDAMGTLV